MYIKLMKKHMDPSGTPAGKMKAAEPFSYEPPMTALPSDINDENRESDVNDEKHEVIFIQKIGGDARERRAIYVSS